MRKIEFVRRAMDRIDFDCRYDVKTGLLKAEAHASGSSKEVDSNGPRIHDLILAAPQFIVDRFFRPSSRNTHSFSSRVAGSLVSHCQTERVCQPSSPSLRAA